MAKGKLDKPAFPPHSHSTVSSWFCFLPYVVAVAILKDALMPPDTFTVSMSWGVPHSIHSYAMPSSSPAQTMQGGSLPSQSSDCNWAWASAALHCWFCSSHLSSQTPPLKENMTSCTIPKALGIDGAAGSLHWPLMARSEAEQEAENTMLIMSSC